MSGQYPRVEPDYNWWGVCQGCGAEPWNEDHDSPHFGQHRDEKCPVVLRERVHSRLAARLDRIEGILRDHRMHEAGVPAAAVSEAAVRDERVHPSPRLRVLAGREQGVLVSMPTIEEFAAHYRWEEGVEPTPWQLQMAQALLEGGTYTSGRRSGRTTVHRVMRSLLRERGWVERRINATVLRQLPRGSRLTVRDHEELREQLFRNDINVATGDAHTVRFDKGEHVEACWGPGPLEIGCDRPASSTLGLCERCRKKIESRPVVRTDGDDDEWPTPSEVAVAVSFRAADETQAFRELADATAVDIARTGEHLMYVEWSSADEEPCTVTYPQDENRTFS
ncbi:MAG: hypothetical protein M3O70_08780 [Actinomycetota bacterium]|nr:hypothetical protein [Actinomycetota bacterium]